MTTSQKDKGKLHQVLHPAYSKWFSSAALHGVILDWVEQQSIVKEVTPGNQNFQETGQFCQTIF